MAIENSVPTVDIGPYLDQTSTPAAKAQVVDEVKRACSRYGFLQLKGHNIPLSAQREVLRSCETFFNLPHDQKEALSLHNSPAKHGYERLRGQILDPRALPDEKETRDEGFYIGREECMDKGFRRGPNQWPPTLPPSDFRLPVTAYYAHVVELARAVLEMLVLGLGHRVDVLDTLIREPVMNLKLLHYPPSTSGATAAATMPTSPGEDRNEDGRRRYGAAEHTDFGMITVLLQQPGKHGLQVFDAAAESWMVVPAVEDVLVVNMGDLLQKWTGGEYRSTVHRVIHVGDTDRYSVPCFYEGNYQSTNPFKPDDKSGETVEEHIRRRFDKTYGLEGAE